MGSERLIVAAVLWWKVSLPALGQGVPVSNAALQALLVRMNANLARNIILAQQYTSTELWHNLNFDKNGKTTVDESARVENVFVEGCPIAAKWKKTESRWPPRTR